MRQFKIVKKIEIDPPYCVGTVPVSKWASNVKSTFVNYGIDFRNPCELLCQGCSISDEKDIRYRWHGHCYCTGARSFRLEPEPLEAALFLSESNAE